MKRNSFLGIAVTGLCFLIAVYFYGKPEIMPNDAVLILTDADQDTALVVQNPKGFDYGDLVIDTPPNAYNIEFYDYRMSDNVVMMLDTFNILTIYDPKITVVWDTLK